MMVTCNVPTKDGKKHLINRITTTMNKIKSLRRGIRLPTAGLKYEVVKKIEIEDIRFNLNDEVHKIYDRRIKSWIFSI